MKPPPTLPDEAERVAALEDSRLVFSPAEDRFDRITRLAATVFDAPIALVTLVDVSRQYFKSAQGLDAMEIPREHSFCAHAIAEGDRLVVEDATRDERFADNPFVTGDPSVRAYAGKVIRSPSGQPLGTLCILDSRPRHFTEEQIELLDDLKAIVESELQRTPPGVQSDLLHDSGVEERLRRLDAATRCWNHDAMVELLMRQAKRSDEVGETFALGLVQVERLGQVSDRVGEAEKNQALREVAVAIKRLLRDGDALGRFEEQSFILLLAGADRAAAVATAARIRDAVASRPYQAGRLSVSLGATLAIAIRKPGAALSDLLEATMRQLEQARADRRGIAVLEAA